MMNDDTMTSELTAEIVAAYVSKNHVPTTDLPTLIADVHLALTTKTAKPEATQAVGETTPGKPAVPVRKSVGDDAIACLECGREFKTLKRHLNAEHGLSPAQYRERWGLKADYPLVAPNYSAVRSQRAKETDLGKKRER